MVKLKVSIIKAKDRLIKRKKRERSQKLLREEEHHNNLTLILTHSTFLMMKVMSILVTIMKSIKDTNRLKCLCNNNAQKKRSINLKEKYVVL